MSTLSTATRSPQAQSQVFEFGQSASSASELADNADYGFIALLGLIQRLGIEILPLTWQAARGSLEEDGRGGRGGQAKIYQSEISPGASFAFKRFSRNDYHEIVSELLILTHEVVRKHPYIIHLEGLCWDVRGDDDVRPVLVFEKSSLGDLFYFMKAGGGKMMSINNRLRLCVEIGIAIRDMHANKIVHGDIKPRNIIVFDAGLSRYTVKIGDFGFSTRFTDKDDLLYMPKSRIWHAPEWHSRAFPPEDAKRMDIFSYGMVCLWMLFGVDVLRESTSAGDQLISFEEDSDPTRNCLETWKFESGKDELMSWAISIIPEHVGTKRHDVICFFESTVAKAPKKRNLHIHELIRFLDPAPYIWGQRIDIRGLLRPRTPARSLPLTRTVLKGASPIEEHFEIPFSFARLIHLDYRIPSFIVAELKLIVAQSQRLHRVLPKKAALQLALSYAIGFGVHRDEKLAHQILSQHKLDSTDLERQIRMIRERAEDVFEGTMFAKLGVGGFGPATFSAQYYKENNLLERARIAYHRDLLALEQIFPHEHSICLLKKADLSNILINQRRWKEAKRLSDQLFELSYRTNGPNHLTTLALQGNLAKVCQALGEHEQARKLYAEVYEKRVRAQGPEDPRTLVSSFDLLTASFRMHESTKTIEAMLQQLETNRRVFGPEHHGTLSNMVQIGEACRLQGQLEQSEKILTQAIRLAQKTLGQENPDTLVYLGELALTYEKQGKHKQAGELFTQVLKGRRKFLGGDSPDTCRAAIRLGIICHNQRRLREAADIFEQVMEIPEEGRGLDDEQRLSVMCRLAWVYAERGPNRWKDAEDLCLQSMNCSQSLFGEEHDTSLYAMDTLAKIYWTQRRWNEAEELFSRELLFRQKQLGREHHDTLTCMSNLAMTYAEQGRQEQAAGLFIEVWETANRVLGPNDRRTVSAKGNLESLYENSSLNTV